jgi:hypothetical protein
MKMKMLQRRGEIDGMGRTETTKGKTWRKGEAERMRPKVPAEGMALRGARRSFIFKSRIAEVCELAAEMLGR